MNTCDTCKHWSPPESFETCRVKPGSVNVKDTIPAVRQYAAGTCSKLEYYSPGSWLVGVEEERWSTDEAGSDASDSQGIQFNCGPKFGCIHHEKS